MLILNGDADAMICGLVGKYRNHFEIIRDVIGYDNPGKISAAMNALILQESSLFITDTHVNENPNAEELAEITQMGAKIIRHFGLQPRVALVSHSSFGSHMESPSAIKMRKVLEMVQAREPDLMIDGEMHADAAMIPDIRNRTIPDSPLVGPANLLVMPNIEAASISYNLMRVSSSDGVTVGPILMGMNKPAHILSPISTVRRIVNMVALACVEAQNK